MSQRTLASLTALALTAGSAQAQTGPTVELHFPSGSAVTNVTEITVSGSASDPDGVQSVTVSGVPAQSTDGFAHWSALVPLQQGKNLITVTAIDALGNNNGLAASTSVQRQETFLEQPFSIGYDALRGRCLVLEPYGPPRIATVDTTTGDIGILSGEDAGQGPPLSFPSGLIVDAARDRALVTRFYPPSIIAVNLVNGDRTLLAGENLGSGPSLSFPRDLELLPSGKAALVSTNIDWRVLLVDLETGDRVTVTELGMGSGPEPSNVRGLTYDPGSRRAILTDSGNDRLLWLDLATGARSVLSGPSQGAGPLFDAPVAVRLAPGGGAVFVSNEKAPSQLFSVDLQSGDRSIASDVPSSGALTPKLVDLASDPTGASVFLLDGENGILSRADTTTGAVSLVRDESVGAGAALGSPGRLVPDPVGGARVISIDATDSSLRSIALASGSRTVVSSSSVGAGPQLSFPVGLDVESSGPNGSLVVVGYETLWRVQRASGDRSVISSHQVGSGPMFDFARGVAISPQGGAAYVLDAPSFDPFAGIYRVDLSNGDRVVVSANGVGFGPGYAVPEDIVVDPTGTRIFVTDASLAVVLEVDPLTGDRFEFSGANVGSGPPLTYPGAMIPDFANQRLFLHDAGRVLSIDLNTADRTLWARPALLTGPTYQSISGLALFEDLIVLAAPYRGRILSLNLAPLSGPSLLPRQRVITSK